MAAMTRDQLTNAARLVEAALDVCERVRMALPADRLADLDPTIYAALSAARVVIDADEFDYLYPELSPSSSGRRRRPWWHRAA